MLDERNSNVKKNILLIILLVHLFSAKVEAQISRGITFKTIVFQDVFYQNPNLIIEKRINPKFSVEILGAIRNSGFSPPEPIMKGGGPIPQIIDCQGFTAGFSVRYFFLKKRTSPNSWYVSGVLRYNDLLFKNLRYGYDTKFNANRSGIEIGALFGRQFLLAKFITTEFYIGAGAFRQTTKEHYYSEAVEPMPDRKEMLMLFRPYLGWTVGFFIPW